MQFHPRIKGRGPLPVHELSAVNGHCGPEAREILFQAIANGSVVSWQHINLLGEYDFSDEKLQDSVGIKPPKICGLKAG